MADPTEPSGDLAAFLEYIYKDRKPYHDTALDLPNSGLPPLQVKPNAELRGTGPGESRDPVLLQAQRAAAAPDPMHSLYEGVSPTMGAHGMASLLTEMGHDATAGNTEGFLKKLPMGLGVFAGARAKTANLPMLERAKAWQETGLVPRDVIWRDTGWFQGADKKWRFEIPDNTAGYLPGRLDAKVREQTGKDLNEVRAQGVQAPLFEVLEHPALYDAYPGMSMTPWKAMPPDKLGLPGYGGVWRGELNGMEINNQISPSLPRGKSITLHEAQHGIQDAEGFAKGSNKGMFELANPGAAQRQLAQVIDAQLVKREAESTGRSPAEIEFQWRHEYGLNPQPGLSQWLHHPLDKLSELEQRLRGTISDARNPSDAYHRTAGEVEARNVQKRMDMTPEQRRATPPWETQDVPDAQQILRQAYGEPQMSIPPPDLLGQLQAKYQAHSSNPPNPGGQQVSLILPDGKYIAENLPSHSMLLKHAGIEDSLEGFMGKTGTIRMHGPDNYELHAEPTSRQISQMVKSARDSGASTVYVDDMRGAEPRSGAFSAREIHRELPKFLAGETPPGE